MANDEKYDSVDDIPSPPIASGYTFTFRTVINNLNKIIGTFIDKFKESDNTLTDTKEKLYKEIQGKYGTTETFPASDLITRGLTKVQGNSIVINTDRKYNHGFFMLLDKNGNRLYDDPIPWSSLNQYIYGLAQNGSYENDMRIEKRLTVPLGGYVYLQAKAFDTKIEITPQFIASYSNGNTTVTIPANSLKIQYELH